MTKGEVTVKQYDIIMHNVHLMGSHFYCMWFSFSYCFLLFTCPCQIPRFSRYF